MEEEKEKKTLTELIESHPQLVFWIRFVFWAIFAAGLPFAFIVWRFELFTTISKIRIGGWGIIGIVILGVFVLTVAKYIKLALSTTYSLVSQWLSGIIKVIIPILAFYLIIYNVRSDIELLLQVLGVVIVCEFIAIPINPLPKWAYEKQKNVRVEERKETMDYLLDGFFNRKSNQEGKDGE